MDGFQAAGAVVHHRAPRPLPWLRCARRTVTTSGSVQPGRIIRPEGSLHSADHTSDIASRLAPTTCVDWPERVILLEGAPQLWPGNASRVAGRPAGAGRRRCRRRPRWGLTCRPIMCGTSLPCRRTSRRVRSKGSKTSSTDQELGADRGEEPLDLAPPGLAGTGVDRRMPRTVHPGSAARRRTGYRCRVEAGSARHGSPATAQR